MRIKILVCLSFITFISQAQEVFNNPPPQTFSSTNFYGTSTTAHSPDYYDHLITTQANQQYQGLVAANQAKQNDPQLKALQDKMLNSSNDPSNPQPLVTTNNIQAPQNAALAQPAHQPPQPNVIYQTPVNNKNSNNSATNLSSGSNNNSNNNSGSSSLDIQY